MGGNRDWKARGGPRGLYSLPLPLIRVEPAPPGPSGCSQAKRLPGRAAEQSYGGGLVLLARERVPNGVPHLRPPLWQVRAESPPSARGHGSPPGALAWPGGPGSCERGPWRTQALSGLGRRRGRPLRELPGKDTRDPGEPRPAGVPRGLEGARLPGPALADSPELRSSPGTVSRRWQPELLYKEPAAALIRPRQRAETPPGGSGRARGGRGRGPRGCHGPAAPAAREDVAPC